MDRRLLAWAQAFEPELMALWSARRAFDKSSEDLGDLDYSADSAALLRIQSFGVKTGNKELQLGAAQLLQTLKVVTSGQTKAFSDLDASWATARLAVLALTVCFESLSFSDAATCLDNNNTKSFKDYMSSIMANLDRVVGVEVK